MDRNLVSPACGRHAIAGTGPQDAPAREYAALVSMADAVYCVDTAGRITFVNPAFEAMTGYALADLLGTPSTHLYVPEAAALFLERRRQVYSGAPVPPCLETVLFLKNGRQLPVELSVSSLIMKGQISGRVGVLRDITDRKQAEAALREREEHIRRLNTHLQADLARMTRLQQVSTRLVQTHDVAALLDEILDAALAITDADMGNIQLLDGDTLKIVAHRGFEAPFLDFFNTVHEGLAACGTALQRGERIIVEDVTTSPLFVDSPAYDVMLAAQARAVQSTPLITRAGRMLGMFSTHYRTPHRPTPGEIHLLDILARQAADAIERAQAEAALRESEERFRVMADNLPLIVWLHDAEGRQEFVNHTFCEYFGVSRAEMREDRWRMLIAPGRRHSLRGRIPRLRPRAPAIPCRGPRPTRRRTVAVVRIVGPAAVRSRRRVPGARRHQRRHHRAQAGGRSAPAAA